MPKTINPIPELSAIGGRFGKTLVNARMWRSAPVAPNAPMAAAAIPEKQASRDAKRSRVGCTFSTFSVQALSQERQAIRRSGRVYGGESSPGIVGPGGRNSTAWFPSLGDQVFHLLCYFETRFHVRVIRVFALFDGFIISSTY
jgi:hypothetical protein